VLRLPWGWNYRRGPISTLKDGHIAAYWLLLTTTVRERGGAAVKVGRVGEFIISARAVVQGTRFTGVFRITRPQQDWTVTLPFQEQDETDDTYETRDEAIDAAYAIAEALVKGREKTSRS
jgi:hypothetical protein